MFLQISLQSPNPYTILFFSPTDKTDVLNYRKSKSSLQAHSLGMMT